MVTYVFHELFDETMETMKSFTQVRITYFLVLFCQNKFSGIIYYLEISSDDSTETDEE